MMAFASIKVLPFHQLRQTETLLIFGAIFPYRYIYCIYIYSPVGVSFYVLAKEVKTESSQSPKPLQGVVGPAPEASTLRRSSP